MTFVQSGNTEENRSLSEIWTVGAYVRLSKEDGDRIESDSIRNQKKIIENHIRYLQEQGEHIASVTVYSDDGYAGGNFDRPAYRQMMQDVETGKLNCIIFKDNSRLGRNYPELGRLMEDYFPQKGVRVISVLNHLDSLKDPYSYSSAIVSFSNIVNDDYIRQLSVKIKSTLDMKRRRGEFIGNYAPYGYVKSAEDRHKLVIDPEAAKVVRMIFGWYADGVSVRNIVQRLNAMRIVPPSVYKTQHGCKGFEARGIRQGVWALTSVNTMLRDEVYIGNLVQGKHKSVSYRSKKTVPTDERCWTVVENTHEPIISLEQFAIVHERFSRNTKTAPAKTAPYLLSGYIRCAHCGGSMNRVTSNGQSRYRCVTRTYAPEKCRCPSVKESLLEAVIRDAIRQALHDLPDPGAVVDKASAITQRSTAQSEYAAAIKRAERETAQLQAAKFSLYDHLQSRLIDQDEYLQFKARYETRLRETEASLSRLKSEMEALCQAHGQDDAFVGSYRRSGTIDDPDRAVLNHFLDHVEVTDAAHIAVFLKCSPPRERSPEPAENRKEPTISA